MTTNIYIAIFDVTMLL